MEDPLQISPFASFEAAAYRKETVFIRSIKSDG
jgi:hypothetical protein